MRVPSFLGAAVAGVGALILLTVVLAGLLKLLIALVRQMRSKSAVEVTLWAIASLVVLFLMLWVVALWALAFEENFLGSSWPG